MIESPYSYCGRCGLLGRCCIVWMQLGTALLHCRRSNNYLDTPGVAIQAPKCSVGVVYTLYMEGRYIPVPPVQQFSIFIPTIFKFSRRHSYSTLLYSTLLYSTYRHIHRRSCAQVGTEWLPSMQCPGLECIINRVCTNPQSTTAVSNSPLRGQYLPMYSIQVVDTHIVISAPTPDISGPICASRCSSQVTGLCYLAISHLCHSPLFFFFFFPHVLPYRYSVLYLTLTTIRSLRR